MPRGWMELPQRKYRRPSKNLLKVRKEYPKPLTDVNVHTVIIYGVIFEWESMLYILTLCLLMCSCLEVCSWKFCSRLNEALAGKKRLI